MLDPLDDTRLARIESETQRLGHEIFSRMEATRPLPWNRQWWDEKMLGWAMRDERVKVQMFRFVDVLPTLRSDTEIVQHVHEYFGDLADRLPAVARLGLPLAPAGSVRGKLLARAVRLGATNQARQFIAGSNVAEVRAAARRERTLKRGFTLDILGEAVTSDAEADRYFQAYLELIRGVAQAVNSMPEIPQIDRDHAGPLARANISVKLSALDSQSDPIDREGTMRRIGERLRELLRAARAERAFINIDMESYRWKDLTLAIFQQVLAEEEFRGLTDVGIAIQAYLKDTCDDLCQLSAWAADRGTPVWVRLVKGAYWDYETVHARAHRWPVPVFQHKWESDANFERVARLLIANHQHLRPALASHNVRSIAQGLAVARELGLPDAELEVQMLYGMADPEKAALVDMGYRVRVYMPYGELIPGMAYLVRRLLENTANDSFLRASFTEHVAEEKLLMNPLDHAGTESASPAPAASPPRPYWQTFENEPHADFSRAENRGAMQEALDAVAAQLGRHVPLHLGGQGVNTAERLESRDPSNSAVLVGTAAMATAAHVDRAVQAARAALPAWAACGAETRARFLRRAADALRGRRFELAAWIVRECGKGWREADADVCEAIDFCEYYAVGTIALAQQSGVDVPGEENRFVYRPRGVTAVIAPWNFPLAILTGMTTAALATGNTVVMKPAEQSPLTAALLMDVFAEIGLPAGVLNFLPGQGETAGSALVEHPDVALIVFTGSRQVGLAIHRRAAELSAGGGTGSGVKKVITEMGGKNAIVVDADADLDEAVVGVVQSAFGYQGQKCSACSRAIVLESAYEPFLARLVEAARSLKIGPASDPASRVGPVIDEAARANIERYIGLGRQEGREVLSVEVGPLAEQGFFVGPHIFADVAPDARIAQEEIFGPVLAVIRATDFDDALRIANDTDYALTGAVFSRSPAHLNRARREFQVGNLYLNRDCTGALVGRQPFGGFKFSGIGSKAGGPDYLLQFVEPRTITENTMRRGFAPTDVV